MTARRRDLDVVRELVVGSLVFFHTARIFDHMDFYVKNDTQYQSLSYLVILLALWGMPLVFMIAGFAIWRSLQKRHASEFVRERLQRLFIPFVFALLVLVPPQTYFRLAGDPAYPESYLDFFPRFFDVVFSLEGFPEFFVASPETGLFQTSHLWFLFDLFLYTLLLLPVLLYALRPAGRKLVERFAGFASGPWTLFMLALPVALIEAAFGTEMSGGWNQMAYVFFILYGFVLAADERFGEALGRYRKRGLVLAIAGSLGGLAAYAVFFAPGHADPLHSYDTGSVLLRFVKGLTGWFWLVAIVGFIENARRVRSARSAGRERTGRQELFDRVERYANEAVLPFYLLHQSVIVVIGFYVVRLHAGALPKFLIISLASLAVTLILYELVVRRTGLTRFLFGMRPKRAL
jgi:surface polysaccharide O-acyltransferase-like enzyme